MKNSVKVGEWCLVHFVVGYVVTEAGPAVFGLVLYGAEPTNNQIEARIKQQCPSAEIETIVRVGILKIQATLDLDHVTDMVFGRLGLEFCSPNGDHDDKTTLDGVINPIFFMNEQ